MKRAVILTLAIAVTGLVSCSKSATRDSMAPPGQSAVGAAPADAGATDNDFFITAPESEPDATGIDDLAPLQTELSEHEAVLVEAGVGLDDGLAAPASAPAGRALQYSQEATTRCERICKIAEAVCDLETKICEMGERHPDDSRYDKACARAKSDCERASTACDECS